MRTSMTFTTLGWLSFRINITSLRIRLQSTSSSKTFLTLLMATLYPVEIWSADAVGLDLLLGSIALGAAQVAVLSALALGEPLSSLAWIGVALCFGGVAVLACRGDWSRLGDVLRARDVLTPFVARAPDSPDFWATWLEATRRVSLREGAPWHSAGVDVADAENRARNSLTAHPEHARLRALFEAGIP